MSGVLSDTEIESLLTRMRGQAREYGQAEGQRVYLERYKDAHIAILMKRYERLDPIKFKSAAAQEREALADPEYKQTLEALDAATAKAVQLKWELEIGRSAVSLYQTKQANRRQEMKLY